MLVDRETREIFVYGPIGGSFWEDGITAELMIQALAEFRGQDITVRINSPGGVANDGIAIYNALRRHNGDVTTIVDSVAASAASIVAAAGKTRKTAKGGKWMIHKAIGLAFGNAAEIRKYIEMLDVYDRSIIEIYQEVMQSSSTEIEAMLDAETWFTGDEAIAIGLATESGEDIQVDTQPAIAAWYKHAPQAVAASSAKVVVPKYPTSRQAAEIRNRSLRLTFRR